MPDKVVSIRLGPEDLNWVDAQRGNKSVSEYIRKLIRESRRSKGTVAPPGDTREPVGSVTTVPSAPIMSFIYGGYVK